MRWGENEGGEDESGGGGQEEEDGYVSRWSR